MISNLALLVKQKKRPTAPPLRFGLRSKEEIRCQKGANTQAAVLPPPQLLLQRPSLSVLSLRKAFKSVSHRIGCLV